MGCFRRCELPANGRHGKNAGVQRSARAAGRFQEAGLLLVVVLLGAFLAWASEPINVGGRMVNNFLRLDNLIPNVATTMSWMAILAVGVTIVIVAGGIDISVGSIFGLAALGTAAVLQHFPDDAPAWRVVPVGVVVPVGIGLVCGLINGLLVTSLRVHPFIITLGTLSVFRGIALVSVPMKSVPSGDRSLPAAFTERFISWQIFVEREGAMPLLLQPVPMIVMGMVLIAAWWFLAHTVAGRQIYAVGGNEEAARFAGLPVTRIKVRVYALCGTLAGVAGMVSTGYFGSANTATGEGYELMVIAAAVVGGASLAGGRGTALGAVLGALVIKLIENGIFILKKLDLGIVTVSLSKEYSKIIIGTAIIVAVAVDRLSERWRR